MTQTPRKIVVLLSMFVLACVLAASAGCANGPRFQPLPMNTAQANIYIYRPSWPIAAVADVTVLVNGVEVGILHSGGYLATQVAPGQIVVTGKTIAGQKVSIDAEAGHNYYVRVDTITDGNMVVGPWIQLVRERQGFEEINDLKLSL